MDVLVGVDKECLEWRGILVDFAAVFNGVDAELGEDI
jgi:hypothetical protein